MNSVTVGFEYMVSHLDQIRLIDMPTIGVGFVKSFDIQQYFLIDPPLQGRAVQLI